MAKILVTGGFGFIGSHLVDRLVKDGHEVFCGDLLGSDIIFYKNKSALRRIFHDLLGVDIVFDIRDYERLRLFFQVFKPEYIFHCAALTRIQPSLKSPHNTYQTNVMGTLNLLEAARQCGTVKKFVYSASSSVYAGQTRIPLREDAEPRPLNPYADSKLIGEMLVKRYAETFGVPGVCLRYFNVYGPRQPSDGQYATVIGIFLRQWRACVPLTIVPDGFQRRDFTYVSDVARANILAMKCDNVGAGEIINIGSGVNHSIWEVAQLIIGIDLPPKKLLSRKLCVMIEPRRGEARETLADIRKAKKLLGWEPKIFLEEGIAILKN